MHGLKYRINICETMMQPMAIREQLLQMPPNFCLCFIGGHHEIPGTMMESARVFSKVLSTKGADSV